MRPRALVLIGLVAVVLATPAHADAPSASASASVVESPLAVLPKLQPIEFPPAAPDALENLSARLEELSHTAVDGPLAELDPQKVGGDLDHALVPAMRQRIEELRDNLDGKRASDLLEKARRAGKRAIREQTKGTKTKKGEEPDGDWLVFVMAVGDSDDTTWRDAVQLYGMLRMLEAIGTTDAVRQMINCYSFFGELVRIDLERAFERLKDRAVAALIEAKEHDARKVRTWARRQLDMLGRAIPGEAVSTTDPQVLADVFRAFGRVRDVDAARVVLSFTNSDRVQLRAAAREAVAAIGAPAWGHYKDAYKNLMGDNPPRGWDWERTVRELFRLHDRARLTQVYELWEQGQNAANDKRWEEATDAYDKVLARAPMFDERHRMATAYRERASVLIDEGKDDAALVMLRKALRLSAKDADTNKIASRLAMLEGKALLAAGTPDRHILQRALELDPDNAQAKQLLASLEEEAEERRSESWRYIAAAGIGVFALVLMLLLWRRPRRKSPEGEVSA